MAGCSSEEPEPSPKQGCVSCHTMDIDQNHNVECSSCHRGIPEAETKDRGHQGLEKHPAHPNNATTYCTPCHTEVINSVQNSIHYTLSESTNLFRGAFGAKTPLESFIKTPAKATPSTTLELADDLLRRRCFTCHLYDSGQSYPSTGHGQGCAACHLTFNSSKESHLFTSPTDERCLSCHYGNYVGFDYYGRFEHDFNQEYRTPYTTKNEHRPYGIEYRQLSADIHQQKGLSCIDCHSGNELMLQGVKPSCQGCHDSNILNNKTPENITRSNNSFIFTDHSGTIHPLPTLLHSAHFDTNQNISCQGCHAQWSVDDQGRHFLRVDSDELDSFSALTVQGNYEVETLLANNFDFDKEELPITMSDSLKGEASTGIWLKGYVTRRWEEVNLGRGSDGRITVVRPILDYSLSWVDEDENVIFDAVQPINGTKLVREYTPHTMGSAGLFYQARIQQFLIKEKQSQITAPDPFVVPEQ